MYVSNVTVIHNNTLRTYCKCACTHIQLQAGRRLDSAPSPNVVDAQTMIHRL